MRLTLGPSSLKTELDFTIFQTNGIVKLTAGRAGYFDKIGLNFSGGPDSVALLCLILSELHRIGKLGTISVVCFTVIKNDGATYYATRALEKIKLHFGCEIEHVNNIPNPAFNVLPSYFEDEVMLNIVGMKENMILYSGMNLPPTANLLDLAPSSTHLNQEFALENRIVAPFYTMHKPQILDILYSLGCEHLLPYTHSCIMQAVGSCGKCFSCQERAWGFRELNKVDPGTIEPTVSDISYGDTWDSSK